MLASEVRALVAGLVVVSVAGVGAGLWRHQHPDVPVARLLSPSPETPKSETPKPQTPAPPSAVASIAPGPAKETAQEPAQKTAEDPAKDGEATKEASPKVADLGIAPPAPKPPEPEAGRGEPPHFDVVRVEPSGDAVLAGKGDPNADVDLMASGKVVASAKADSSGHFVILPPTLTPGNYELTLRQTDGAHPAEESKQSVAVSVPAKGGGQLVVAMAEPGKPTKLIAGPPAAPVPPAKPAATPEVAVAKPETVPATPETEVVPPAVVKPANPDLAIRSVELENGNGFFASGAAASGTRVQIYLNGAHLAEVIAGPDGQWSVTIKKGLTGGHYVVRADAGGEANRVTARVEVPFDVPVAMAEAQKPTQTRPQPAIAPPAQVDTAPEPVAKVAREQASPPPPAEPAPLPPSAPNPDDVAGLGPEPASAPALTPPSPGAPPPVPAAPALKVATAAPPAAVAQPTAPSPKTAPPPAAPGANAVIEQVATALVVPGDNLWNISRARLGYGKRFTEVYAANVSQIRDPKLIYPGQVFVVPSK